MYISVRHRSPTDLALPRAEIQKLYRVFRPTSGPLQCYLGERDNNADANTRVCDHTSSINCQLRPQSWELARETLDNMPKNKKAASAEEDNKSTPQSSPSLQSLPSPGLGPSSVSTASKKPSKSKANALQPQPSTSALIICRNK